MNRFDFYKDLYYKELERKKALNDSLTLPIGIITGIIAWLFYFYNTYFTKIESKIPTWLIVIFICSLVALVLSIIFLSQSYFVPKFSLSKNFVTSTYDYNYIDFASKYEKYYLQTKDNPSQTNALEELLIEHFVGCSEYNTSLNDRKTARLLRSKIFFVFSLFLSFFLLIYPVLNRSALNQKPKPQEIKIVNPITIKK